MFFVMYVMQSSNGESIIRQPMTPAAFLKSPVHVKGNPGQIAKVFQQGKQREEDGHRRQHYRNHLGQNPVNAVNQYVDQLDRGMKQQ